MNKILLLFQAIIILIPGVLKAQDVGGKTRVSQSRTSIANIGNCDITIKYHSPSVNGRKIFGGIVPFDFVVKDVEYPWRAGSNERTTIDFSHPVEIEGQKLDSGSYGFLVLVSENEWVLIFSSGKSWGAFNYDKSNDILRVPVKTQKTSFQEWLSYEFVNPQSESVDIKLLWENTAVQFNVSTNALSNVIADLTNKEDKTAADYQNLAKRTLEQNPSNTKEALELLELSMTKIADYESLYYRNAYTFNYKILKGEVLQAIGQKKEGDQLIEDALSEASGFSTYYYALNKLLVKGEEKEALEILEKQIDQDPDNRANYLALGEYYLKVGNQRKVVESFQKAYEKSKGTPGENYARYLYLQNKLVLEK